MDNQKDQFEMQQLTQNEFIEEMKKRFGSSAEQGYKVIWDNKNVCYDEDNEEKLKVMLQKNGVSFDDEDSLE